MRVFRFFTLALSALLLLVAHPRLQAQTLDLGLTYDAAHTMKANTNQSFWMQGGSLEFGADAWRGFGIAANVSGFHAASIGGSGVPISLITATFGPRYRWRGRRRFSVYGEALLGEANGFYSLFPTPFGSRGEANSLALHVGGGMDYKLTQRISARLLDAAWLRTELPNATDNVQNDLCLGAGLVLRWQR